jgi:hypothetical protein
MNDLENLKQRVSLLEKESEVNNKANSMEFRKIMEAFQRFGNLLDLLHLEVAVLIEMLDAKKIISQDEFAAQLEETGKKIEERAKEKFEEMKSKGLAGKLDDEKEDPEKK